MTVGGGGVRMYNCVDVASVVQGVKVHEHAQGHILQTNDVEPNILSVFVSTSHHLLFVCQKKINLKLKLL